MKRTLTICPYCGCGCGLYLQVEDNKVIGIIPSKEHPITRGSLCIKGWSLTELIMSLQRLKKPLIRKNGHLVETEWDIAISIIADKLKIIKAKNGSNSIGVLSSAKCTNEENYLMMKFARAVLGTNNVDHCARLCHASTVVGLATAFGSGAMTNSINEVEEAEVILVTGSNTTEQHPHVGSRILKAVKNGAQLIVIDPRKIKLSQFANLYLQPRVGTDVAWINGLMNVIINENLADLTYIQMRTENFDLLKAQISKYTPPYVEEITGIPSKSLIEAARIYASAKGAMIIFSMGITQHIVGTDNVSSLANLAMLTAHVGQSHTGVNPLRGQNNVQGACDLGALPNVYSGYQKVTDTDSRRKFEKAWKTKLPEQNGLTVTEMMDAAKDGSLKAMYIMGENPMLSDPDLNHVREALQSLDFLVVQDMFLTETAQLADIVLPAASFAEKEGTFTNTERRVQRVRKAIEPLGESKPDWEIICELAKKMGYIMDYQSPKEIMEEIALLTPIYGGIYYDRLDNQWGLQWPCPDYNHPGTPFLHKGTFSKGKGSFVPIDYIPPDELPDEQYPFILTTGRVYFHWHTGSMSRKSTLLRRECPTGFMEINPEDAQRLKIRDGELVKVNSRRGEIEVRAKITDIVPAGTVFIPFHFSESPVNVLTNPALDPKSKIPELKICAVNIIRKGFEGSRIQG